MRIIGEHDNRIIVQLDEHIFIDLLQIHNSLFIKSGNNTYKLVMGEIVRI